MEQNSCTLPVIIYFNFTCIYLYFCYNLYKYKLIAKVCVCMLFFVLLEKFKLLWDVIISGEGRATLTYVHFGVKVRGFVGCTSFNFPYEHYGFIRRRHHFRWRDAQFRALHGACGLWAGSMSSKGTEEQFLPRILKESFFQPFYKKNLLNH